MAKYSRLSGPSFRKQPMCLHVWFSFSHISFCGYENVYLYLQIRCLCLQWLFPHLHIEVSVSSVAFPAPRYQGFYHLWCEGGRFLICWWWCLAWELGDFKSKFTFQRDHFSLQCVHCFIPPFPSKLKKNYNIVYSDRFLRTKCSFDHYERGQPLTSKAKRIKAKNGSQTRRSGKQQPFGWCEKIHTSEVGTAVWSRAGC